MRYKLTDGRVVQADAVVDFTDDIRTTALKLTPEEREKIGLVEIVDDPRPDERYGYVTENPEELGKWIFTPFSTERLKQQLLDYAGSCRYSKEVGGVLYGDKIIATDRDSQKQYGIAQVFSLMSPSSEFKWKLFNRNTSGEISTEFIILTAAQLTEIGLAVGTHVQQCFALEATVVEGINAGTITTYEDVKKAFE